MTKEDKELLLKDLSGRIPYGVKFYVPSEHLDGMHNDGVKLAGIDDVFIILSYHKKYLMIDKCKPYLRSMSSMTRKECIQLNVLLPRYFIVTPECLACLDHLNGGIINFEVLDTIIDFYNSHHLDWRGLISKGLALEAPKDMYK